MKRLLLVSSFVVLCFGQQTTASGQNVRGQWAVSAKEQTIDGHFLHLRGQAEMRNTALVFRADVIDFDEDNAIVRLTGHATIESKDKGTVRANAVDYYLNSGRAIVSGR
jgi:lipopolysaccharide export system protein LptA